MDVSAVAIGLLRTLLAHRAWLKSAMESVAAEITSRATVHDLSKLLEDEFEGYCRINSGVRAGATFGSDGYRELMDRERLTIEAHYGRNSHHPERQTLGHDVAPMTFIDVVEMVCDWWASWKSNGSDGRSWPESASTSFTSKAKYLSEHQLWLAVDVATFLGECHRSDFEITQSERR